MRTKMQKKGCLIVSMAFLMLSGLYGCKDDGEVDSVLFDKYTLFSETCYTDSVDGCVITRDESDRIVSMTFFHPGVDPVDKLYGCPASLDEVKHLVPLSEGNEIRLTGEGSLGAFDGQPELLQYRREEYRQYYKGVPVSSGYADFFVTPQGRRISQVVFGPFIDIKDFDTTPRISEQQARQKLADYLGVAKDDSWPCGLCIKEFSTRENDKVVRHLRLVYQIMGPVVPDGSEVVNVWAPRYEATVDAHTGELIRIG